MLASLKFGDEAHVTMDCRLPRQQRGEPGRFLHPLRRPASSAPTDLADRPRAIPAQSRLPDLLEEGPLGAADVGDLDHGAWMGLGVEIGKAPLVTADLALMADPIAERERPVVERLVVVAPVGHVLEAFVAGLEEFPVQRRRVVALLDQLDLEVAGIGQRDAHLDGGVLAAMAKPVGRDAVHVVPGTDAHYLDPVLHRGVDVPDHITVLAYRAEDAAHARAPLVSLITSVQCPRPWQPASRPRCRWR